MNTILHIVKKDLRIGGSSILIFLGLLVLNLIAQSPIMPEGMVVTQIARNLLPMVQFIVLFTCMVTVLLEDPVAGTDAFWVTRPPRGGTLLAAKALLIGAMVCAYLLGQIVILVMNGGFRLTPYLLGGFAFGTVPIIAIFFVMVSMASDPLRFFVKLAIVAAAFGVLMVLGNFLVDLVFPGGSLATVGSPTVAASARVAVGVGALIGSAGLVWHQYATRRTLRTGILGGLVALALAGLFLEWKIDFFGATAVEAEEEKAIGLDAFHPVLRADSYGLVRSIHEDQTGEEHVRMLLNGGIQTSGLTDGWMVKRIEGKASLATTEGVKLEANIMTNAAVQDRGQPSLKGFHPAGGAEDYEEDTAGVQVALVDLPEEEYRALGKTAVSGTLELTLVVVRREIVAELALVDGADARVGAESWRLRDVRPSMSETVSSTNGIVERKRVLNGVEIGLDVCAPDLWLLKARKEPRSQYFGDTPVVLMNRERREWMRRRGGGGSFNSGQPGVPVSRNSLSISFDGGLTLDQAWIDGATLGIVDDRDVTTVRRTLRVEGVSLIQD
jgi:hypothetical protein